MGVEHETCDACGFDGAAYSDDAVVAALRGLGPKWRALLDDAGDHVRTRPAPEVWSALEYAAHSRDITALHVFGVDVALTTDDAQVPAIDGDAMIEQAAATYATEAAPEVLAGLERETQRLAQLGADHAEGWHRTLTVGDDPPLSVRRLLEHALHDSTHHLADVARGLDQLRG